MQRAVLFFSVLALCASVSCSAKRYGSHRTIQGFEQKSPNEQTTLFLDNADSCAESDISKSDHPRIQDEVKEILRGDKEDNPQTDQLPVATPIFACFYKQAESAVKQVMSGRWVKYIMNGAVDFTGEPPEKQIHLLIMDAATKETPCDSSIKPNVVDIGFLQRKLITYKINTELLESLPDPADLTRYRGFDQRDYDAVAFALLCFWDQNKTSAVKPVRDLLTFLEKVVPKASVDGDSTHEASEEQIDNLLGRADTKEQPCDPKISPNAAHIVGLQGKLRKSGITTQSLKNHSKTAPAEWKDFDQKAINAAGFNDDDYDAAALALLCFWDQENFSAQKAVRDLLTFLAKVIPETHVSI